MTQFIKMGDKVLYKTVWIFLVKVFYLVSFWGFSVKVSKSIQREESNKAKLIVKLKKLKILNQNWIVYFF
ncbi:hypothetical protein C2855_16140 [Aeromonas bestiarum]|nr:hypothetical protein C2855_16140 [Aeromonas bestiarum]